MEKSNLTAKYWKYPEYCCILIGIIQFLISQKEFLQLSEKTQKSKSPSQIKSRERVANHGEVFTAEREVKAMCDLVKDETERIESKFLEPACGNGNFLAEILTRKLAAVEKKYKKNPDEREKFSLLAISSVYGIDIMADNVLECRERLFGIWRKWFLSGFDKLNHHPESNETDSDLEKSIKFVLSKNICLGNALTLKKVEANQSDTDEPIIFCEWSFLGDKIKRRDFSFNNLMAQQSLSEEGSLFAGLDDEDDVFKPEKEFPLVFYRKVYEQE